MRGALADFVTDAFIRAAQFAKRRGAPPFVWRFIARAGIAVSGLL